MDRDYGAHRVVAAETPGHDLYIGLFVSAQRPTRPATAQTLP
jgi:hypothetical protein